ncbi:MAG: NAD-dependent epimerase/dehydratase family protein [Methylococcales bacterium]|nr:NAD-dependent epimerase/dehydratase family protein [Methylococcales bacterium]
MAAPRILVTGATGMVGSALCRLLHEQGFAVRAAVRCGPQATPWPSVVTGELGSDTDWRVALEDCQAVVHLAAAVHDQRGRLSEADYWRINHQATLTLAEQSAALGVRRLLLVSTVKIHGESSIPGQPFRETDPARPDDAYARSKWAAEQAVWQVAEATGLEVVVVRPPLVYGPGVKANFLQLLRWARRGLPLPLGKIHNQRSLIGLANLTTFLQRCLTHPDAAGQTFLVADRETWSTGALYQALARAQGVHAPVWPLPRVVLQALLPSTLEQRLCASLAVSTDQATQRLGWQPPYSAETQLADTVTWYRQGGRPWPP